MATLFQVLDGSAGGLDFFHELWCIADGLLFMRR
jgi:hypothetical protein